MDMTIPAPQGSTETAAPQVTAQTQEQPITPQAETPAGTPPADEALAGKTADKAADPEPTDQQQDDDGKKTWKEKRAERNRERWREYKAAKDYRDQRMSSLEAEVSRLRSQQPPDYSQIMDPQDELAERTAHKLRQQQAADAEARLREEREFEASQYQKQLSETWKETLGEVRERIPDFDQVFNERTPIHGRAVPHIVESDLAGELAYYLGKNVEEARSLFQKFETAPAQALIELGRIEARLSAPARPSPTQAPKPAPIISGGTTPIEFDPGRASVDDFAVQLRKAGIIR